MQFFNFKMKITAIVVVLISVLTPSAIQAMGSQQLSKKAASRHTSIQIEQPEELTSSQTSAPWSISEKRCCAFNAAIWIAAAGLGYHYMTQPAEFCTNTLNYTRWDLLTSANATALKEFCGSWCY